MAFSQSSRETCRHQRKYKESKNLPYRKFSRYHFLLNVKILIFFHWNRSHTFRNFVSYLKQFILFLSLSLNPYIGQELNSCYIFLIYNHFLKSKKKKIKVSCFIFFSYETLLKMEKSLCTRLKPCSCGIRGFILGNFHKYPGCEKNFLPAAPGF